MAVAPIFRILLIAIIARCRSDTFNYKNGKAVSKFGELLKPPPPPLSNIVPVPFHGGSSRSQRQNLDTGYVYQPPPPPPPPPVPPSSEFKFPAPFYKQYNFNFVPPPQPFTTTPAPSIFQKVSGWLFPSQQNSYGTPQTYNANSITAGKKDCNPCNLVPWIPVLRYTVGGKSINQNSNPTYGPPSPTAYAPNYVAQYRPQPFLSQDQSLPKPGVPHAVYGPPPLTSPGNNYGAPISTYGPPSPTHTVASPSPPSSTYSIGSSSSSSFVPSSSYGVPSQTVGQLSSTYGAPSSSYGVPSSTYGIPSSTYGPPLSSYGTPSPPYETPAKSTFSSVTPNYELSSINNNLPHQSEIDVFQETQPSNEFQLPKVTHPSGFRNSYGEPIINTYALNNIPFPVSATAAESTKIKTEVLPDDNTRPSTPNTSLALANPAPFTLNRGRNIHTLQPVALPNLSVSPLPPIFNARPFRPMTTKQFIKSLVPGINTGQQSSDNVKIEQSLPLAEFTHSIDYPPTVIKSTFIDIDAIRTANQTKAYRNIPNEFIVDQVRDISSQASEDHPEATKTNQDSSFETTGADFSNDLYDTPLDMKHNDKYPSNHKTSFADLRGVKDEDVDKYRTESNLQNIDSPLLYLKPSAPHKDFGNFIFAISSTPGSGKDYEIYDDVPSTNAPQISTFASAWDESRTDYSEGLLPPPAQEDRNGPKIVQIIVPYTTGEQGQSSNLDYENNIPDSWTPTPDDEYQGRKVPNTDNPYISTVTEGYSTIATTEETVTESYDAERLNTQAILNDLYDVKEPPFDIIKLQHTIDDWTEQEYSKRFRSPHKTRTSAKYAKQIPDEYFTTISPFTSYVTAATNYNYEFYDHEGASSMQHAVTDSKNKSDSIPRKEYNTIERTKAKYNSAKNEDEEDVKKPQIYTAASSFRSTTTTPAPWGSIQTSISPLTKEKVYVVTAKPWKEAATTSNKPNEWYDAQDFESKKTNSDNDVSASDSLLFKSPRFSNRPSFGFTSSGNGRLEPLKSDSSYAFSKNWHQRINDLENQELNNSKSLPGGSESTDDTTTNGYADEYYTVPNTEEDTATTTTAEPQENEKT
ncbi:hypothetical protein O0L34_g8889 [Tuta absoluta]|nr:hypothetical protein O0L34_g8889 [Tuta absoluta]